MKGSAIFVQNATAKRFDGCNISGMLSAPAVGTILGGVHHQHRPPRRTRQQSLQGCVHESLQIHAHRRSRTYCKSLMSPIPYVDDPSKLNLHRSGTTSQKCMLQHDRQRIPFSPRVRRECP
jgi:hypothetical protein